MVIYREIPNPWDEPHIIQHTQRLITSFEHWTGRSLYPVAELFYAPIVVVSHGTEPDPIFNYGNDQALALWEFDWAQFTQLPSRLSAEPTQQIDRDRLLAQAKAQGYIDNYQGIRISRSGRRFRIKDVILWDVLTETGENCGQAAMFKRWDWVGPADR
jgi:hypothetical protein